MKQIYIKAAEQTKFGELYEYSLKDLVIEAAAKTLKSAKLEVSDLDLIVISSMTAQSLQHQGHLSAWVTQLLGSNCPVISVDAACAGGGSALGVGMAYLKAGEAKNVLVLGVEKLTDFDSEEVAAAMMQAADWESEGIIGLTFPAINALVAERYFFEHPEIDRSILRQIAIANHTNGAVNEYAHLRRKITEKEYDEAEMVCSPLKLYDCAPISDGAVGVIISTYPPIGVTPGESVPATPREPTCRGEILGFGQEQDVISLYRRKTLTSMAATQRAMSKLLKQTGIMRSQISVAEVHDAFSILQQIAIEDLGLKNVLVNQSGGLKACGHPVAATGLRQVRDVLRFLKRGQIGIAQNMGGIGGTVTLTLIFK